MNVKLELILNCLCNIVCSELNDIDIDIEKIVQTTAISALTEIQEVLKTDNLSDFYMIEEIILICEKYNIDCGVCHDFG